MKNKIILSILILSVIALIFSGCDGGGFVTSPISDNEETSDYFQLDVPYIEQNSNNTCLPASGAMILKYYEDSRDIAEIRDKLALPWQADGTGGIMDSGHGSIAKLFDYAKSLEFTTKTEWDGLTIEEIKDKLEDGFPIIVLQDFYLDSKKKYDGHFSVVVGYREIGDNDEENKLIINDPWSSRGQYWEVTYSDFKIRNSNWWKEQHNRDSDLSHSYIIWKDTSTTNIYTITASAGSHGSISPSGDVTVNQGSDKSFTITPDTGYSIDDVLVDGSSVGAENSYTFTNVTQDHTISAAFTSVAPGLVHNINKGTYYNTIQAALDDADNDNTIEVSNGTYDESITFPSGKKLTLQSINGASSTTIRGDNDLATVTFNGSLEATLEGFTITHTSGNNGRGIYISNSYLTINNCIVSDNSARDGGGIYNGTSRLTITESIISNNSADHGGGIDNIGSLTIIESIISGNTSDWGGGISNSFNSTLNIITSTISNNFAIYDGGGIYNYESSLTITESTISGNHVSCKGGGIYKSSPYPCYTLDITVSTISGNYADNGGGIYFDFWGWGPFSIGGSSDTDKNTICGNYKIGYSPSLDQQIRDDSGSLYETYKDTNYISVYCD